MENELELTDLIIDNSSVLKKYYNNIHFLWCCFAAPFKSNWNENILDKFWLRGI